MIKNKITLKPGIDVDKLLQSLKEVYKEEKISTIDGMKIDFEYGWLHLRKSNTEPIMRVYAEANSLDKAEELVSGIMKEVRKLIN